MWITYNTKFLLCLYAAISISDTQTGMMGKIRRNPFQSTAQVTHQGQASFCWASFCEAFQVSDVGFFHEIRGFDYMDLVIFGWVWQDRERTEKSSDAKISQPKQVDIQSFSVSYLCLSSGGHMEMAPNLTSLSSEGEGLRFRDGGDRRQWQTRWSQTGLWICVVFVWCLCGVCVMFVWWCVLMGSDEF